MTTDVHHLADDPDLAPLWHAIHRRLCAGESAETINTVRVAQLSRTGVSMLRTWLDTTTSRRRRSAVSVTAAGTVVPLRELLQVLRIDCQALPYLVERATGEQIVNRSLANRASIALREQLWEYAARRLPQVPRLVARLRAAGLSDDDTDMRRTIDALADALALVPAIPPMPLAKLAHDTTRNPHFFDLGTTSGARLVAAIAELTNRAEPTRPDLVRELLAGVGILADRLSATVLLLNVDAIGDGPIDERLRTSALPVALTLLDLIATPPTLAAVPLTVVENPSVLEIALIRQSRISLACTSGQLRAVDHVLLQLANRCGVPLRYAGDVDNAGIQIAETVAQLYQAELIAMDATTVAAALNAPVINSAAADWPGPDASVFQEHDAVLARILEGG
ncbi:TIGR02679 domain-containing protein [Dactylosporangium sp. NPDC051485]|uniref:TIGR02679 domain-containing protein n=1 Tax=Dactylosporangium sp. NPDC051485 TaxID=3154846 RepID=UPI00342038A4